MVQVMVLPGLLKAGPRFVIARSGSPAALPGRAICNVLKGRRIELPVLWCDPADKRDQNWRVPAFWSRILTVKVQLQVSTPEGALKVGPAVMTTFGEAVKP